MECKNFIYIIIAILVVNVIAILVVNVIATISITLYKGNNDYCCDIGSIAFETLEVVR
jgi:hypothetical protein